MGIHDYNLTEIWVYNRQDPTQIGLIILIDEEQISAPIFVQWESHADWRAELEIELLPEA